MRKKAIISDLDNTIYPVSALGEGLYASLLLHIRENGEFTGEMEEIKSQIMRRPFQSVAKEFAFSQRLQSDCFKLLTEITCGVKIEPFEDYKYLREIPCKKFLVTSGFYKMQQSKIQHLNIANDFERIFIIDPSISELSKKEVFIKILIDNSFEIDNLLVVGDDINSEIKAANELGIDSVLYDYKSEQAANAGQNIINNFCELELYI